MTDNDLSAASKSLATIKKRLGETSFRPIRPNLHRWLLLTFFVPSLLLLLAGVARGFEAVTPAPTPSDSSSAHSEEEDKKAAGLMSNGALTTISAQSVTLITCVALLILRINEGRAQREALAEHAVRDIDEQAFERSTKVLEQTEDKFAKLAVEGALPADPDILELWLSSRTVPQVSTILVATLGALRVQRAKLSSATASIREAHELLLALATPVPLARRIAGYAFAVLGLAMCLVPVIYPRIWLANSGQGHVYVAIGTISTASIVAAYGLLGRRHTSEEQYAGDLERLSKAVAALGPKPTAAKE